MRPRLLYLNIVLYLGIALLASLYWRELRWALDALPGYLDSSIKTPEERILYREAERNLGKKPWGLLHACKSAERALAIDPNCEAGYWLAKCLVRTGRRDRALELYRRYSEIDSLMIEPYLMQSALLVQRHDYGEAKATLRRGIDHFSANAERYRSKPDPDVPDRYNAKAEWVAEYYRLAAKTLEREIGRVETARARRFRQGLKTSGRETGPPATSAHKKTGTLDPGL